MTTPRSLGEERGCPICGTILGTEKQTTALHITYRANLIVLAMRVCRGVNTDALLPEDVYWAAERIVNEFLAEEEEEASEIR